MPVFSFETKKAFYDWLAKNYSSEQGFWLRYYKKNSGVPTIVHGEAVDVALCWGWIDGLTNGYDELSYLIRFTQRRPKSVWSQINVAKVEKLIAEGLMQPSGMAHIEAAKNDGRWEAAYAGQSTMELPKEFIKLVSTDKDAKTFFDSLNKTNSYAIAFRIATAVGKEKKERVMQKMFEMLKEKKTFY